MPPFSLNRSSRRPAHPTHAYRAHHGVPPRQGFVSSDHPLDHQLFDYLIVVDFECTCERDKRSYPNEIIEFPGVLVDVRRGIVDKERSFHTYVKPWRNPTLTKFCTELTGITQAKVDGAPSISEAVQLFVAWYRRTIPRGAKVVFATDGPWDFKNFLFTMAVLRDHVALPMIFYEYLDIRTTFSRTFNKGDPIKLDAMLKKMKLRFEGNPHSGFDDSVNIARLAVEMMRRGCVFQFLICLPLDEEELHYPFEGYPLYRREEGSGFVTREHVEEAAKSCFGQTYFDFALQQKAEVAAFRAAKEQHSSENSKKDAKASRLNLLRRRDGGLMAWESKRRLVLLFIAALLLGSLFTFAMLQWQGRFLGGGDASLLGRYGE